MKVAIVGSGISGLAAAHALRVNHEVELFEAADRLGGHANTVDVEVDGRPLSVDTGFIVYNEKTYPGFVALLDDLGVATQASDMSFGVACERTGIQWASHGPASFLARPSNLLRAEFRQMARDVVRFNRDARGLLDSGDVKVSLGAWLEGRGYSRAFSDLYLRPMGAAIWSSAPDEFLDFPAASFVRFFDNHQLLQTRGMIPWRTIAGGSRRYVDAIAARLEGRIHLDARILQVERDADGVQLRFRDGTRRFDRVILATHSDQALALLAAPTANEREILSAIRYQRNDAVLHTDERILPASRRAWASWNYRIPTAANPRVLVTYDMSRLQSIASSRRLLVTLNPDGRIDPDRVLARMRYDHPVFDTAAASAQQAHGVIDGGGGVHFCGAYWRYGFHEDGLWSGLRAAQHVDGEH